MKFEFFEGAAGTGKTHNLVGRAGELVRDGLLDDEHKVLALTFMNGARRRLEARLGANPLFRRRYDCRTFDMFARTVATRRRSLICTPTQKQAATLNEFDKPCFLAASLLGLRAVQQWVARGYPLIVVDEVQDLDKHRLGILQGLATSCHLLAAGDAFQCLTDQHDTAPLIDWLENAGETHHLTRPMRTAQHGLLAGALAVREGRDIKAVLAKKTFKNGSSWSGPGIRLLEVPAQKKNTGLLAWSISNEIAQRNGPSVILTPDSTNAILQNALRTVQTRPWPRNNGATFGPFSIRWDREDKQQADELLGELALPQTATYAELYAILAPLAAQAPIAHVMSRVDRLRRVQGKERFSSQSISEFIHESVRNQSRLGFRPQRGHNAMTIWRAKNREFANVIVLWPHSVTGSPEHLRRLLYNAITRAIDHCSVIVVGKGRLDAPPFAPR